MEKKIQKHEGTEEEARMKTKEQVTLKKKVSKAWEAAQRLKGSVIINDPTLYWR